jgi:exodeoxyribonuclease VII large subunit
LTTYGGPNAASAASASAGLAQLNDAAVGIPAAAMTCLANDLEPSIRAAAAAGPKQARPASRSASPAPATSGASGPMTTRSGLSLRASARIWSGTAGVPGWVSAIAAIPGLPGAACRVPGSALSARTMACSRPPDPMTRMRTPGD